MCHPITRSQPSASPCLSFPSQVMLAMPAQPPKSPEGMRALHSQANVWPVGRGAASPACTGRRKAPEQTSCSPKPGMLSPSQPGSQHPPAEAEQVRPGRGPRDVPDGATCQGGPDSPPRGQCWGGGAACPARLCPSIQSPASSPCPGLLSTRPLSSFPPALQGVPRRCSQGSLGYPPHLPLTSPPPQDMQLHAWRRHWALSSHGGDETTMTLPLGTLPQKPGSPCHQWGPSNRAAPCTIKLSSPLLHSFTRAWIRP